ncbi:hypothetical protein CQ018_13295 [Arthrobacter sp. MYb227]|uniref:FAD-dependent monooxygenase n=1 Tax=Arthrobacter sp. MYb227 TaxID=1848601 RepID=UPI000CFD86AC|nr:FAD-dependent monooxygenase [Arthrobacter sp. MYb227]PQZ91609.1 hypothetical protein CQ018_13295 [Arthrobacter sp. MYb227]
MSKAVIVGAGPAGMMLAAELKLAGIDVQIVEKRSVGELIESRAGGIHCRTIETFDQRGIAERFLNAGTKAQTARFGGSVLDISDFPTRHPYGLGLWQSHLQPILEEWITELGVWIRYGVEVTGFTQDESGVTIETAEGEKLHSSYLIGADGGRSLIRTMAGIDFPGWAAMRSNLIAEVEISRDAPVGMLQDQSGVHGFTLMENGHSYRVVTTEPALGSRTEPTLEDLRSSLLAAYGSDFGVHNPTSLSRFTDATRQATTYRKDRILLVGDAAHIHYPAGGQGIGLGIQDAVNLGWKLAQVIEGRSPESLLDTYTAERHPVELRALKHSMAQTVLQRNDPRTSALAESLGELMVMDEPRKHIAALIHGLDITYDLGAGHPMVGRRMPDLDLETADGRTRVYTLLHAAKPVLLNFQELNHIDIGKGRTHIQNMSVRLLGDIELPLLGRVTSPGAVLIRPDGYVAWAGEGNEQGLEDALAYWCGQVTK